MKYGYQNILKYLKITFAIILITVLFYIIDPVAVFKTFQNITLPLLVFLIFISFVLVYVSVLKWKILLETTGQTESIVRLFGLYLVGFFFNLIFPSYLGGDAIRSYYLGKKHGQHQALSATALERYSGLLAMLVLAWIFMWQAAVVTDQVKWTVFLFSLLFILGSLFLISSYALKLLELIPKVGQKLSKHGFLVQEGLKTMVQKPKTLFQITALSFLFHSVTVVNVVAAGLAVGWHQPPAYEIFVVLPIILLISALPVAPQGLGVQEGAFVYYLTLLGATPAQALGIALILRAKAYLLAIFGWGVWLLEEKNAKKAKIL